MLPPKTARELMQSNLVITQPEALLKDAWKLMSDHQVTGLPVIDQSGMVVGVVSLSDLARAAFRDRFDPHHAGSFYQSLPWSPEGGSAVEDTLAAVAHHRVGEVMNPYVVAVPLDASVQEISHTLRTHRVHRVLVTEGKKLRGIVTSFDLLALLEA